MRVLRLFIFGIFLAGCVDRKAALKNFEPKDDDAFARTFINLMQEARYEEADRMLKADLAAQIGANGMVQLHQVLDHGTPITTERVGWNFTEFHPFNGGNIRRVTDLAYQLRFSEAWVAASFVIESSQEGRHITAVYFQPLPDSLEVLNQFSLSNKSPMHYLFLAVCILNPVFMLATAVTCLCSRVRRRWLWIMFILIGFVQFSLNWTSGALSIQLITASLLGAGFWRPGLYGPWTLKFAIPVGAIVFLIFRSRLERHGDPPPSTPSALDPPVK